MKSRQQRKSKSKQILPVIPALLLITGFILGCSENDNATQIMDLQEIEGLLQEARDLEATGNYDAALAHFRTAILQALAQDMPVPDSWTKPFSEIWSRKLAKGNLPPGQLDASSLDNNGFPEIIHLVPPTYPRLAMWREIEGLVVVMHNIQEDGTTSNCRILDETPVGVFADATCESVNKMIYEPYIRDGNAMQIVGAINIIQYSIEEE